MGRRVAASLVALALAVTAWAGLSPEVEKALGGSKFVYVQSQRKSGELGKPAEIWFYWDKAKGAVYVGTRPTSWRVRRIKAGRTRARVAVGKADGPAFDAKAAIVSDRDVQQALMESYAKKYGDGWSRFEKEFRSGFESGDRVLVRYTPVS